MNTNATHSEMPTLLTPADAATILHVPVKTLARWRFENSHLPYVTLTAPILRLMQLPRSDTTRAMFMK